MKVTLLIVLVSLCLGFAGGCCHAAGEITSSAIAAAAALPAAAGGLTSYCMLLVQVLNSTISLVCDFLV
jgi:hypothetical protein